MGDEREREDDVDGGQGKTDLVDGKKAELLEGKKEDLEKESGEMCSRLLWEASGGFSKRHGAQGNS
jgi:hypothetical protein